MYVSLSIMKPNTGQDQATIESMHRFSDAARSQEGIRLVTTLRDPESGDLIGLAVWETDAAARAAGPALGAAVADDDFDTLVAEMRNMHLEEV
jgi:hypothetical protein